MIIVGGAAVALDANPDREGTIDIDVFAKLTEQVQRVIAEIAVEQNLPHDWVNANAQQFMSQVDSHSDLPIQTQVGGVTIHRIDNRSLLAMKLRAGRIGKDLGDIEALVQSLGVRSVAEAQSILDDYYGSEERMKPTSAQLLEDLFKDDASTQW